jgi:hypothetical protein
MRVSTRLRAFLVIVMISLASAATTARQEGGPALAGQAPAQTFADLQPLLKTGQTLIVEDEDGRTTSGRLVSLAGDRLEISSRRGLFGREPRVFSEVSVRRIRQRDSTWNGALIGLGAGVLAAFVANGACTGDHAGCLSVVVLAPFAGLFVGDFVDGRMNRTVYLPAQPGGIVVAPLLGPAR